MLVFHYAGCKKNFPLSDFNSIDAICIFHTNNMRMKNIKCTFSFCSIWKFFFPLSTSHAREMKINEWEEKKEGIISDLSTVHAFAHTNTSYTTMNKLFLVFFFFFRCDLLNDISSPRGAWWVYVYWKRQSSHLFFFITIFMNFLQADSFDLKYFFKL